MNILTKISKAVKIAENKISPNPRWKRCHINTIHKEMLILLCPELYEEYVATTKAEDHQKLFFNDVPVVEDTNRGRGIQIFERVFYEF